MKDPDEKILISYKELRKDPDKTDDEIEEFVAKELENLADHIRKKKWPMICDFTKKEAGFFTEVRLVLSWPWG